MHLGFTSVSDYVAGKRDWLAAGRPYSGEADLVSRHVDGDVLTCSADDRAGDVAAALHVHGDDVIVLGRDDVVLGALHAASIEPDDDRPAIQAAMPAPTTVRASEATDDLRRRMAEAGTSEVLVTTPEGRLLGRFR